MLNRSIMNFASHSYKPIMILVIESGAVYSATLLALLILYKAQSWFQYVLLDAVSSFPRVCFFGFQISAHIGRASSAQISPIVVSSALKLAQDLELTSCALSRLMNQGTCILDDYRTNRPRDYDTRRPDDENNGQLFHVARHVAPITNEHIWQSPPTVQSPTYGERTRRFYRAWVISFEA